MNATPSAATPVANGKAVATPPAQPIAVAAQPTPATPTGGRRNFVAAQAPAPGAQSVAQPPVEQQAAIAPPKADPPVRQRAVATLAERTVDASAPTKVERSTKAGAMADTNGGAKGKSPSAVEQPMPTPLKMKAPTASPPVEAQQGQGTNDRKPSKAESAAPTNAGQTKVMREETPVAPTGQAKTQPTQPSRAKLTPAQAPLPVGPEALVGNAERKEAASEKPTEPTTKPAKAAPTEARPLKLTAPKATADNGVGAGKGKPLEEPPPPKAGKQSKEAPAAQTLELFPVDATEAPKTLPSKLKIAVSVNRPTPKRYRDWEITLLNLSISLSPHSQHVNTQAQVRGTGQRMIR